LWSLHPECLDAKGLVALWREALLAQKVLLGQTRGYQHHPQLQRFRGAPDPVAALGTYLRAVVDEACVRGYCFDDSKIVRTAGDLTLPVTSGQLAYEWEHLRAKLAARSPLVHEKWRDVDTPRLHPMFIAVPGAIEAWERLG